MYNHYLQLIKKYDLPKEVFDELVNAGEILIDTNDFKDIVSKFYRLKWNFRLIDNDLELLSKKSGIHKYTVCFVFIAASSIHILEDFRRANISEDLYWETIEDLKYKLFECKNVHNVWGNFVMNWYGIFFKLDIFKLGRLEFERAKLESDYSFGEYEFKKGDTAFSVHIPSSGSLSEELRLDSYKRAYEFFSDERQGKPLICFCASWLLYPQNREIFPPYINLVKFMDDWDIVDSGENEKFDDAWRVFGKDYEKGNVPSESTQQKALIKHLDQGGKTGWGRGILIFDGEKIINRKN